MKVLGGRRNPKAELEQQAAFEEAERTRAELRAGAVFESFISACPAPVELFAVDGQLLRSNQAAERLLGKVPPPGISLFDVKGLKRTGLLEPQLKRILAGTRVETPPTDYDPTEIGLPGTAGKTVQFRATVFPLFDNNTRLVRIAVLYEPIIEPDPVTTCRETPRQAVLGLPKTVEGPGPPTAVTELPVIESKATADLPPTPTAVIPDPRFSEAEYRKLEARAQKAEEDCHRLEACTQRTEEEYRKLEDRRQKMEQALREGEARWRAFIEESQGYAVLDFNPEGRIVAASPSIQDTWGISANTLVADSSTFYTQIAAEDRERVRKLNNDISSSGKWPERYRFRVRNKSTGAIRWIEMRGVTHPKPGQVRRDRPGPQSGFSAVLFDVTRLLELEQLQETTEAALGCLMKSPVDGIAMLNSELEVISWSPGAESVTGVKVGSAVGRVLPDLCPGLEKAGFVSAIRRTLREQKTERHEAYCPDENDSITGWLMLTSYPFQTGVLLLIRNLTEQRLSEDKRRQAEDRLGNLLATPGLCISLKDMELRYRLVNNPALEMFGLSHSDSIESKTDHDLLKKTVADLLADHDRQALAIKDSRRAPKQAIICEIALPSTDGKKTAWYRFLKMPFTDSAGKVNGVLTVAWDISTQVNALQEMTHHRDWLDRLLSDYRRITDDAGKELKRWRG